MPEALESSEVCTFRGNSEGVLLMAFAEFQMGGSAGAIE